MERRVEVAVVGGGQAGLAVSHELSAAGVEHVVLDRGRIGQTWRDRWDSFCLVTPNWALRLPGHRYAGQDPDGFMPRDEVVAYLDGYAQAFGAPVREGVEVRALERAGDDGFRLTTSEAQLQATSVVLATGAYQRPHRPPAAATLPRDLLQLDVDNYRQPGDLPPGRVLAERGLPAPDIAEPEPFDGEAPERLDLRGFGAVIFAGGFRPDYTSWLRFPDAFDALGFPVHEDGASTAVPDLYFVGVHFLRKRKSSLLVGVGRTPPSSPPRSPGEGVAGRALGRE